MTRFTRIAGLLLFAAILAASSAGQVVTTRALSCEVTNLADSGAGSLREAMSDSDCDSITFAEGLTGTITLATDLPVISRELTITGPGNDAIVLTRGTIHAGNAGFSTITGGDATISGLAITNTRNCVEAVGGTLRLFQMNLYGCYQGAWTTGGSLFIDQSSIHDHESTAIGYSGAITVTNSLVATSYNGIASFGGNPLTVVNTTLADHSNAAIEIASAPLTLLNSTLYGGFRGLGLYASTNGSVIQNTIFAGSGNACGRDLNSTAAFTHNIIEVATNCFTDGVDGNRVVGAGVAGLQGLAENGGPTRTMALAAGGLAVDSGSNAVCAAAGSGKVNGLDQRGVSRTTGAGAQCDIGAFERSSTCFVTNLDNSGPGSLREKLSDTSCSVIRIEAEGTLTLTSPLPIVARPVEIIGPGPEKLTIQGLFAGFRLDSPGDYRLSGMTLTGSEVPVQGLSEEIDLTVENMRFEPSTTAIQLQDGELAIRSSTIEGGVNQVIATGSQVEVVDSTFRGAQGCAIFGYSMSLNITGTTFVQSGESIVSGLGIITIVNSTFANNISAAALNASTLTVRNTTFSGNLVGFYGDGAVNGTNNVLANAFADCLGEISATFTYTRSTRSDCLADGVNNNVVGPSGLDPAGLQDNGGPTETIAIPFDSPARGAGNPAVCYASGEGQANSVDQRGLSRAEDGACDLGAYEYQRKPQTIAPFSHPNVPLASQSSGIQGLSSAGLPLSFSGAISCSVVDGVITFVSAGACELTATQAGNEEYLPAPPVTSTFMIFGPGPVTTITLAPASPNGTNGWYRTPVGVTVSGTHPTQPPIISCGTAAGTATYDWGTIPGTCFSGANTGTFTDSGIFTITAGATTVEGVLGDLVHRTVKIDREAPESSVTGVTSGATYPQGGVPAAGCTTIDEVSGIAQDATLTISGGNQWGGGTFTATCAGARDVAGNVSSPVAVSYNVTCEPTRTYQGIVMVKLNAAVKVPRLTTTTVHFNPATCAVTGISMAPATAPQANSINLATQNANWKPVVQTAGDTWQFGLKTPNAATGGVFINNVYRALNASTIVTLKLTDSRSLAYIKVTGMAPTGVGITLAAIEAETSPPMPVTVP